MALNRTALRKRLDHKSARGVTRDSGLSLIPSSASRDKSEGAKSFHPPRPPRVELATGASEVSSGRLDTTNTTGHTRDDIPDDFTAWSFSA